MTGMGILQAGQQLSDLFDGSVQAVGSDGVTNPDIEAAAFGANLDVVAGADMNGLKGAFQYPALGVEVAGGVLVQAGTAPELHTPEPDTPSVTNTQQFTV